MTINLAEVLFSQQPLRRNPALHHVLIPPPGAAAISRHITVGGEVERVQGGSGVVVSGGVGFHFLKGRHSGLDPFVAGGITGIRTDERSGIKGNIAAGTNYWFHNHIGFRAEIRGYVGGEKFNNFGEVRAGFCFR